MKKGLRIRILRAKIRMEKTIFTLGKLIAYGTVTNVRTKKLNELRGVKAKRATLRRENAKRAIVFAEKMPNVLLFVE